MPSDPSFSCRDTEIVLQMLTLDQHVEDGHGRHALDHVIACESCAEKGFSGISQKILRCEEARGVWMESPYLLQHPETLRQSLALEHIFLKPCGAWFCTQLRNNLGPLCVHIQTVMGELSKILAHCSDIAIVTTPEALQEIHTVVKQAQKSIVELVVKIVKIREDNKG